MSPPAAKQGDRVVGTDTHIVLVPSPPGSPMPTPLPHPFAGTIDGALSSDVQIMGRPAATVGSTATNSPAHAPATPGVAFQNPPSNAATIRTGSQTVLVNDKPVARAGDTAQTCNDPLPAPVGTVVATGTVIVG
jgi:uncharacterized Zn-binding protein involved in type VI secretion